jgi:hypothetical protein
MLKKFLKLIEIIFHRKDDWMELKVSRNHSESDVPSFQTIRERRVLLEERIDTLANILGAEDTEWHLCRREPGRHEFTCPSIGKVLVIKNNDHRQ